MASHTYCNLCGTKNHAGVVYCVVCGSDLAPTVKSNPINSESFRAEKAIIFDIDETILDTSQRRKDAMRAGLATKEGKPKRSGFQTPKAALKKLEDFLYDRNNLAKDSVIRNSKAVIDHLIMKGYKIVYVTARHAKHREVTREQLTKKDFPIFRARNGNELIYLRPSAGTTHAAYKRGVMSSLLAQYDIDAVFDDKEEVLYEAAQLGIPGIYSSVGDYHRFISKSSTRSNPGHASPKDCPAPTQDLALNTKNRNSAIKPVYISYGPLNLKDLKYYEDAAAHWKTDVATAKASKCSNCVAFDISPRMLDCMPGPVSEPIEDEDGYLGYCWMHHFKCHSARTCYTWAAGGPITEDSVSMDWQNRAKPNPPVKPRRKKMKNGKYRKEPAKKYVGRFMGDPKMNKEFPDRGQRYAVALNYVGKFYGKSGLASVGARSNPHKSSEEYSEDYMVPRDIHRLGKAADSLESTYDEQDVPEWWKSKLSVAARDADTLADSLSYVADNPGHRRSLPFRPTSDCFITYKGKLVAKDMGHYIAFPGGGVDPGETPLDAATREVMEETGAVLKGPMTSLGEITWVWNPEWADNEKRKKRYEQFQGERVYFFTGEVDRFVGATSDEGDAWEGEMLMEFSDAIAYLKKAKANLKHPNQEKYIEYQIACLEMLKEKNSGMGNYREAAGAIVKKGNKYLLLRRSPQETSFHGMFELPGGKLEAGETAQQAAVIETKEEAGLDVKVVDKIGQHVDHDMKKIYHGFIVKMKKGQRVKLSEEHDSHKWATMGEIMKMPKNKLSHHARYLFSQLQARPNPATPEKIAKGKKLYKHMNGKEPAKVSTEKIDMGDVWYQVGEGGCWSIGYMSGKETKNADQKYIHHFNEETKDGNMPKLYATMPKNGKPMLIIKGGTWKIKTDDSGMAWIYD